MNKNKSPPLFTIQCYEDRQSTIPLRKIEPLPVELSHNDKQIPEKREKKAPPPPPPMPIENGHHNHNGDHIVNNHVNEKIKSPETMKVPNLRKIGSLTRIPTPDYNKSDSPVQLRGKNLKEENAEVESLESYKLKNPLNIQPKPPSHYFIKAPNGTATMKKHVRPVSVTIGEYVNNVGRKEPAKLEFLNGDKIDGHRVVDNEPITSRLQSELALTLSRSNLRKKTEALVHASYKKKLILNINSNDENFHARYGNNLLPLPPSVTIPKISKINI